jgi:hypothetical protein
MRYLPLAAALIAASASAKSDPAAEVSQARLRADVETLVGFGTRHTLSAQDDPRRGIGAAWAWGEAQFRRASEACGGCLEIVTPETIVSGDRIPRPVRLVDVVAIQRGTERPNEVVIVQGHIDSRVSDVMDAVHDAPGANDDGSGTALVVEAARVLSRRKYPSTIVYALLTGEEQGLYGGKLLADYAAQQGWTVKAVLNNDIVGNSCGSDGHCDAAHVRVFSEGPRADSTPEALAALARDGGENDSPSRNLSRFVARLANSRELAVRPIWRTDRMGRGGDHIPFLKKGYPAVRISVAVEDYEHQHQDVRVEDGVRYGDTIDEMDFPYLARVTRLNVRTLDALARAPMPPAPKAEAAVRTFTRITWAPVAGASAYRIYQRTTDSAGWPLKPVAEVNAFDEEAKAIAEHKIPPGSVVLARQYDHDLQGVRGDDWLFGVSSVAADGSESPVAGAVPGGAFRPLGTD